MATRTRATARARATATGLSRRRMAAVVAQLGSWYTTWLFVAALFGESILSFGLSIAAEWLLFEFKRQAFAEHRRFDLLSLAAVGADTLLNAAGLWSAVLRLDDTAMYKMLAQALGLSGDMRLLPALVLALLIGLALSAAPLQLWRDPDDREE